MPAIIHHGWRVNLPSGIGIPTSATQPDVPMGSKDSPEPEFAVKGDEGGSRVADRWRNIAITLIDRSMSVIAC
jgi:hypothetical protein